MANVTENLTLDGMTDSSFLGNPFSWSGYPPYIAGYTEDDGTAGTTTINAFASGDWFAYGMEASSSDLQDMVFNFTDAADGNTRYIGQLRLFQGDHTINLTNTGIETLMGFRDSDHDITLDMYAHLIRLRSGDGNTTALTLGDGGAGAINIQSYGDMGTGDITVTMGNGGVQSIRLGQYGEAGTNTFIGGAGRVSILELSGTTHTVTVGASDLNELRINDDGTSATITANSTGEIDVLRSYVATTVTASAAINNAEFGSADDTLTLSGGGRQINMGNGTNTLNMSGDRIESVQSYSGNDMINMTGGRIDSVDLSGGRNTVTVSDGRIDSYQGGEGVDLITITGTGRVTYINAGEGDNRIMTGSQYTVAIEAYQGDDWVKTGSGYTRSIYTSDGNDTVLTGSGSVGSIATGFGSDIVRTDGWVSSIETTDGSSQTDEVDYVTIGAGGAGKIWVGDGDDRLFASSGNVGQFDGGDGNEKIYMGNVWLRDVALEDGNDFMRITKSNSDGGARISGGDGVDTLDFRSTTAAINISLDLIGRWQNIGNLADTADFTVDSLGFFSITSTERLAGTAFGDTLTGSDDSNGSDGANRLQGLGGDDTLIGLGGDDLLFGGSGADIITGGEGADYIQGNRDNDMINGGNGGDTLLGGSGSDIFIFENSATMGFDRIKDWQNGADQLDLSAFGFADFAAVQALAADPNGSDMRINLSSGNVIYIEGFQTADFDASDVILV